MRNNLTIWLVIKVWYPKTQIFAGADAASDVNLSSLVNHSQILGSFWIGGGFGIKGSQCDE